MKNVFLVVFVLIGSKAFMQNNVAQKINDVFIKSVESNNCKNAVLQIYSPSQNLELFFSHPNQNQRESISKTAPFYTASITKLLTAVSIGVLKDAGKLKFQDKIIKYLPDTLLKNLHVYNNTNYSKQITISHLLQHTSGLPDYFSDSTKDNSPNILNQVLTAPHKVWLPEKLIDFTKMKMQPHFAPGDAFHYTDTGYVLLALVIEHVSGLTLDEFFKENIFETLEMNNSYINLKSTSINKTLPIVPFYAGESELSSLTSLSADWGGGGLVTTTNDLISFFKAFNNDKIVKKETRLAMQHWVKEVKGMDYGYGIRKVSVGTLTNTDNKLKLIGHSGSTASFLWYNPQLDTYITGSLNKLEASKSAMILVFEILKIIENEN